MPKDKPENQEGQAVVVADSDGEAASNIVSLTSKMNNKQLQAATERMSKQREIIKKFVSDNLVENTDFGKISSGNFVSKPTLFKPGMEKIFSLFGLVTELERDNDTLEMLKDETGLVAFKCTVVKNGVKIAEGRGAAKIGDMKRDANSTIKIAEKRARMDACLSLGFSEFFTQDMEDPEYRNKLNGNGTTSAPQAPARPAPKPDTGEPLTDNQRRMIFAQFNIQGITSQADQKKTLELNGLQADKITKAQASVFIDQLLQKKIKYLSDEAEDQGSEEIPAEEVEVE
jgi:hypothetical protein